jgi:asparagine synthase (glutamine-hydrolysing)
MSAIFGCVSFDGRPLPPETGEVMGKALRHWGPDGLTWATRPGAVLGLARLSITPESLYESSPIWDESRARLFTAAARLDNREELCARFDVPPAERGTFADGALARTACWQWEDEAPRHLFGDWSFADWDERQRTLRLCRDQLGNTGLYYHFRPPLFAFASDPQGLFALDWVARRIHEPKIASYLAIFPLAGEEETCWQDIFRLLPGCSLTVGPDGRRKQRYWDADRTPVLTPRRDEEYIEGFLEHFKAAVKTRLRSRLPVGVSLSAGLDSGAVAALAAQGLGEKGKPLAAFTSVPLFPAAHLMPGTLADEWPLAQAVSRLYPNIEHLAIDAAAVTPLAGIARAVAIHHAPLHAAANQYWLMALHDAAHKRGIGVMLTGQLGNGGVSWSGGRDRIFFLFASGRWDEGRRALTEWRQRHNCSWIGALAECLAKPALRPFWPPDPRRLFGIIPPWSETAAIHPIFAARIRLGEAMRSNRSAEGSGRMIDPSLERQLTLMRNGTMTGPVWHATGAAFAMEVRDPTADIRLVEYCLGIPAEQDVKDGGQRMLIRRSMEGILPPEVQWNTRRGRQAADVAFRLLHHRDEMETSLARLEGNDLAKFYLNLPRLRRVWSEIQAKVSQRTFRRVGTILLRGIMCGSFLEDASGRGAM